MGMEKDFNSFEEAAAETSVSRICGGIHYRVTVDVSAAQEKKTWRFYRWKIRKIEVAYLRNCFKQFPDA